jgi:hypothetical protein
MYDDAEHAALNSVQLEWEVLLDRLDLEVIRIEKLLSAMKPLENPPWEPPSPSAPMPVALLPRAVEIHQRQAAVLEKVMRAMRLTAKHRTYVERLSEQHEATPRYIDLAG